MTRTRGAGPAWHAKRRPVSMGEVMPLRDHFHPPWSEENPWEGFHSAWVNTMVRHLNGSLLPPNFRAFPQIHLGPFVETDVATLERLAGSGAPSPADAGSANGGVSALWSPPEA